MTKLEVLLKNKKFRLTNARKTIYDVLCSTEKALSAQEVFHIISKTSEVDADQASVYRNLSLFSQIGLVHRLQSGKYTLCHHNEKHAHSHIHIMANCTACGNTYEVEKHSSDICKEVNHLTQHIENFESFSGLILQGTCKACIGG